MPEPDRTQAVFSEIVNDNVQSWYRDNKIKRFTSVRPYIRDQSETFLTWTERTILTSMSRFILRADSSCGRTTWYLE
jgi:hypothetical protein